MSTLLTNNIKPATGLVISVSEHSASASVTLEITGNVIAGTSSSERFKFNSLVESNILPDVAGRNLGATAEAHRWNIYGETITTTTLAARASTDLTISTSGGDIYMNPAANFGVGIGTAAPTGALHISKADARVRIEATTANNNCQLDFYNGNGKYVNIGNSINTAGSLFEINEVSPSAGSRLTILTGGNVGIGTTTPTSLLHVNGNAHVVGNLTIDGTTTTVNSTTVTVDDKNIELGSVASPTDSTADGGGITLKGASDYTIAWSNSTDRWHFNQGIEIDTGNLIVDNSVGIGTQSPGTMLQLEGTAPYLTLKNSTSENTEGGCESKIIFEDHADVALAQIQGSHDQAADDTKGDLIFSTHNGTSLTEALRIDSSQNVGIGTTGADRKLEILDTANPQLRLTHTDSNHYADFQTNNAGDLTITPSGGDITLTCTNSIDLKSPQIDIGEDDASDVTINLLGSTNDMAIVYDESTKKLSFDSTDLVVDGANGRVGIGTDSPTSNLELESSSGDLIFEMDNNASNSSNFKINNGAGNQRADLILDGTTLLTLKGQRVGIGTTEPETSLHVQNGSAGTIATTDGALLTLESNEKPKIHFQSPGGYGGSIIFGSPTDNDEGQIDYDHGSDRFLFKTGGNTKMTILGSNVGIGVTDPDTPLEVFSTSTQLKLSYDADSFATMTVDSSSNLTIATGESGIITMSDVLAIPDGSATAPSLTNTGDANCGLYFSAADTLAFTAGGTAQVTFADGVIAPVTTNDIDLGTSSLRFANVYTMDLHLANERGDWTVIEEEDYLSLRNNKNGKLFKIVMQEILED